MRGTVMLCDPNGRVAICDDCKQQLFSPYWSASKSKGLHERGLGHKVRVVYAGDVIDAVLAGEIRAAW
jgi:hypothetical protein